MVSVVEVLEIIQYSALVVVCKLLDLGHAVLGHAELGQRFWDMRNWDNLIVFFNFL